MVLSNKSRDITGCKVQQLQQVPLLYTNVNWFKTHSTSATVVH